MHLKKSGYPIVVSVFLLLFFSSDALSAEKIPAPKKNASAGKHVPSPQSPQAAAMLSEPFGIAIDTASGRIYVADCGNNRVVWWDSIASLSHGKPADGVLGQGDLSSHAVNRSTAVAADTLYHPTGVCVDALGNVWVADRDNNRVVRYSAPISTGMSAGLVLGHADFHSRVANLLTGQAAKGLTKIGTVTFGKTTARTLFSPTAVFVDRRQDVWVSDTGNNRVLKYVRPSKNGAAATLVLGQKNFTSNVSDLTPKGGWSAFSKHFRPTAADTLSFPSGIFVDTAGSVWVADTSNNRVLCYTRPRRNGARATLVLGQLHFSSNDENQGETTDADTLYKPFAVCLDNPGNIWVADTMNRRALRYASSPNSAAPAITVLGQTDFVSRHPSGEEPPVAGQLSHPQGIAVDSAGNVWVSDRTNNRVLRYSAPLKSGAAADVVISRAQ